MKKIISKLLCLVVLCSTLMLSSCDFLSELINGDNGNTESFSVKTLYSYEDVMRGLSIVREKYEVEPRYTVDDMGEEYTVLYYFFTENKCEYPIDLETYFSEKSYGYFSTFILLNNQTCPGHENSGNCCKNDLYVYEGDDDYERLIGYKRSSCAWVKILDMNNKFVKIENKNLLTYREQKGNYYFIYYNDNKIMELYSCVTLDDAFFDTFLDSIVTTEVKE